MKHPSTSPFFNMNDEAVVNDLEKARTIAVKVFGENPSPEIIAAALNAITAQRMNERLERLTDDLCRAAAVAAGQ